MVVHSEKSESHKNNTHPKIKFDTIFIYFFFLSDIKNFANGEGLCYLLRKMRKSQEQYPF